MARTAATRAAQAASGLDAFLRDRAAVDTERLRKASGEENSGAADATAPREIAEPLPGATAASEAAIPHVAPLRLAHTDWLHHTLWVSGPAEDVEEFRRAAAGAGVIPWILDLDRLEEDWFHLLLEPRRVSVAGAVNGSMRPFRGGPVGLPRLTRRVA